MSKRCKARTVQFCNGDCTFVQWDGKAEGCSAIVAEGGALLVRGCEFKENKPQIELGEAVRRAVIAENLFPGKARITNRSKVVLGWSSNDTQM